MKISINSKDGQIYIEINKEIKEFTFDVIDSLIDQFIQEDNIEITSENETENYKLLLEEIIAGVKSEDFILAMKQISEAKK